MLYVKYKERAVTGRYKSSSNAESKPLQDDATSKSLAHRVSTRILKKVNPTTGSSKTTPAPNRREEVFNDPENFTPDSKKELDIYPKNETSKNVIRESLRQHYLFESLGTDDMEKIVNSMKPISFKANSIIICEGDKGDQFFLIESGEAVASVIGVGDVAKYGIGGCFGELALIYNSPRAASVVAKTDVKTWAIDIK